MKGLVLCVCVLILASCSSTFLKQARSKVHDKIENDIETCSAEVDVSLDEFIDERDIMADVHTEPENLGRTRKSGCLIACVMKKMNLMEGTDIKESQVHAKIDEMLTSEADSDKVHTAMSKCMREARIITDECEKCFSIYACVSRIAHKEQKHKDHGMITPESEEGATEHPE
ncbi:PREDICTED: pheromone-binding protein Gp-9-like [Vollenhovia emeryi]|uniref:pheromone-binding protein Gp-9-like n=1 Tax=Vollenhovia emeryi TaxID=411798 RepID=UPI0005F582F8|nr:PREDICTED: pheromone-binding protein Gp-9-like [Vollenhovia emeryi]